MEVLSGNIPAVKTKTADVHSLLDARVNGNGHARINGGNGHRRRVRRQIHNDRRCAALKADTAVMLVEMTGMPVTEAIERCNTSTDYFYAMKALRESGSTLYQTVIMGFDPVRASAKRVKNAAVAISAYGKFSTLERELFSSATGATADAVTLLRNLGPDQLVAASKVLGLDWVWDRMIAAAMATEAST